MKNTKKFILIAVLIFTVVCVSSCDVLDILSEIDLSGYTSETSSGFAVADESSESLPDAAAEDPTDSPPPLPSPDSIPRFNMIKVPAGDYTVPTGTNDSVYAAVSGGFYVAETQVTYALWYAVRVWAENNGYEFQNAGIEGIQAEEGQSPTDERYKPVSRISWRDAIVWCNAISEMDGKQPVYRTSEGRIIRSSKDGFLFPHPVDKAIQTDHNGYRLPLNNEWELVARYRDGTNWTPGDYASGASNNSRSRDATDAVAWHSTNSGSQKNPVGQLSPNSLGIYDMSGNVWEWTFELTVRGGAWDSARKYMEVGYTSLRNTNYTSNTHGFRVFRD